VHADGQSDAADRPPGPIDQEQDDRGQQEDAEGGGLEHGAQDVLPGQPALEIIGIVLSQPAVGGPAGQGGVNSQEQHQEDRPAPGCDVFAHEEDEQAQQ
jgi:hypothetical protein